MNMLEALKAAKENHNVWARPLSWRASRVGIAYQQAIALCSPEDFVLVPGNRGGSPVILPRELFEEWEAVPADDILEGK